MPCRWQGIRSFARRRKPQGKGREAGSKPHYPGAPDWVGAERACPRKAGASGFVTGQIRQPKRSACTLENPFQILNKKYDKKRFQ